MYGNNSGRPVVGSGAGSQTSAGMLAALAGGAAGLWSGTALAAPTGQQVVAGQATFNQSGNTTTITASNNAIINYRGFDVARPETVRFVQPDAASRVLNRVQSDAPSRIDGSLLANGRVYIVNPAGVVFGAGAVVNVAHLYAAAGTISNTDFLSGVDHFTQVTGAITNAGSLNAEQIALIGKRIENSGSIVADGGVVTALVGGDVMIREANGKIYARIDGKDVNASAPPAPGSPQAVASASGNAGFRNTGAISAEGGVVTLGAGDGLSLAIHNAGVIAAHGGRVEAVSSSGTIRNDGTIDVGVGAGQAGSVAINAPIVSVDGRIWANVESGAGGTVNLNSSVGTVLGVGGQIDASGGVGVATGGDVHIASQGDTYLSRGSLVDVTGGTNGGDGGSIKVDAGKRLGMYGEIRGGAAAGSKAGSADIDPTDVVIATVGANDGELGDGTVLGGESGGLFTVSNAAIQNFAGDVRLEATRDITLNADLNKSNGGLLLDAGRNISFLTATSGRGGCRPSQQLTIKATSLDFRAGGSILDFSSSGGTRLFATSGDIRLLASGGAINFGLVTVSAGQTVSLTQHDDLLIRGGSQSKLGDPNHTRLEARSTGGTLTLGAGSCPGSLHLLSLDAYGACGTTVNAELFTAEHANIGSGLNLLVNNSIRAGTELTLHAGQSGTGDLLFCQRYLIVGGSTVTLEAGNGTQGGTARVDARTNTPWIKGANGAPNTRPDSFALIQDAPVTDATLPFADQFKAPIEGMAYRIESRGAGVTLTDPSLVAGTRLTLASVTGSTLGPSGTFFLQSLDVFGAAIVCADVNSTGEQNYHGTTLIGGDRTLTATKVAFGGSVDAKTDANDRLHIAGDLDSRFGMGRHNPLGSLDVTGLSTICGTISTAGAQHYVGDVTLCGDTILESTTGDRVEFGGRVDGTPGGAAENLGILGQLVANGEIGGLDPLAGLTVFGTSTMCGGLVRTVGGQLYVGDMTLCADTTLHSLTGDQISVNGRINGTPGGAPESLSILGNFDVKGTVGDEDPLAFLAVTGDSDICGGLVRTVGTQTYGGALRLCMDTLLESTGGAQILVNGPIMTEPGFSTPVALTVTGQFHANGTIGAGEGILSTLTVNGASELCGGLVRTVGGQNYNGNVTLCADTLMESTSGGTVTFAGSVNGTPGGSPEALTIHGGLNANGPIGNLDPLASLAVTGDARLAGGGVTTVGDQTYGGGLTLGADTALTSTTGGLISISGPLSSSAGEPASLTVNGGLLAGGPIGAGEGILGSLTVNGASELCGGLVRTVGGQNYNGNVTLCTDTIMESTSGGTVAFAGSVNGTPGGTPESLSIIGNLSAGGAIGDLDPLAFLSVTGSSALNGGLIRTIGDQTFGGAVTFGADATLDSTGGGLVRFAGPVDAASGTTPAVTITGAMQADGAIGANNPLGSLAVGGAAEICGGLVRTLGDQSYGGAVTLCTDTTMESVNGGTIAFHSTVDGTAGGLDEALRVLGNMRAEGVIGGLVPLRDLTVTGASDLFGGLVQTTGDQTYFGPVQVGTDTRLASLDGGTIIFGSRVDGAGEGGQTLEIEGNLFAAESIGAGTALGSLSVSGSSTLGCGIGKDEGASPEEMLVRTTGGQTYSGDVTLCRDTRLVSTEGGVVTFGGRVDGENDGVPKALAVEAAMLAEGEIGGLVPLASIAVTGPSALNGGLVRTEGTQTFTGPVTLGADTTLTSNSGALITFGGAVDGASAGAQALAVNGAMHAEGAIGGAAALTSLAVSGRSEICGGLVRTQLDQSFGGAVVLCHDTTLESLGGGTVRFASTLDGTPGGEDEFLWVKANLVANGAIGDTTPLEYLRVDGASAVNGGHVFTQGDQRYNGPVTLGADTAMYSFGAGTIRFGGAVDSGATIINPDDTRRGVNLDVATGVGGLIRFNGDVGAGAALGTIQLCTSGHYPQLPQIALPPNRGVPDRATIIGERSMSIRSDEFVMCPGEKFTTLGDLSITASKRAHLGDLVTVGAMTVRSTKIEIDRRAASGLLDKTGVTVQDRGVDFVAGGAMVLDGTIALVGTGPAPTFSSGDGVRPAALAGFEFTRTPTGDTSLASLIRDGVVLDQRTRGATPPPPPPGPRPDGVLEDLAGATPKPPKFEDSVRPTVFDLKALARVAVTSRNVSPQEAVGSMLGKYMYNDMPGSVETYESGERMFAATRVDIDSVLQLVDRFNATFGLPGRERTPQIGATFAEAAERMGGKVDGLSLRHYIESTPGEREAQAYLVSLRDIVKRLRGLGLTGVEYQRTRDRVLAELATPGKLSLAQIVDMLEAEERVLSMR